MLCSGLLTFLFGTLGLASPSASLASEPMTAVSPIEAATSSRQRQIIRGVWSYALDPKGEGEAAGWFDPDEADALKETTPIPAWWGSKQTPIPYDFVGVVWLGKKISFGPALEGRRVVLRGDGLWRRASFWLNGEPVGRVELPGLPFELDLTDAVQIGEANWLVCAVDNRPEPSAFSVPAFDIYPWGGIPSNLVLEGRDPRGDVWVEGLSRAGDGEQVEISARVRRASHAPADGWKVRLSIRRELSELRSTIEVPVDLSNRTSARVSGTTTMKEPSHWGEEGAVFQIVEVELIRGDEIVDDDSLRTLPRTLASEGQWVQLDGHPISLRGATDYGIFLGRYPPSADGNENRGALGAMKRLGFNLVRTLGFVPPLDYLEAADSQGVFTWLELPIADGEDLLKNPLAEAYLDAAIGLARRHPSVLAITLARELPDEGAAAERARALLAEARSVTDHCFFFGSRNWGPDQDPQAPIEFLDLPLAMKLTEIGEALEPPEEQPDRPVVVRNVGGYGSLPDFFHQRGALRREPSARPPWLLHVKENVVAQDPDYGSFQRLSLVSDRVRSTCLLRALDQVARQVWLAGFEVQTFSDAPLPLDHPLSHVGVANWYAWPKVGNTIRLMQPVVEAKRGSLGLDRFTYFEFDELELRPQLVNASHELMAFDGYGITLLEEKSVLTDIQGEPIAIDPLTKLELDPVALRAPSVGWTARIDVRGLFALGTTRESNLALREAIWVAPRRRLSAQSRSVARAGDTEVVGKLYPWVEPVGSELPEVLITTEIDDRFYEVLSRPEGRVLLLGDAGGRLKTVPSTFEPRPGGSLGAWVDQKHEFFSSYFPVGPFSDLWAYDLMDGGQYYVLDGLSVRPTYLIRGIHGGTELWASLFEIRVVPGRLLACSLDVLPELETNPMAAGLLDRLIHYAASDGFNPKKLIQRESFESWVQ